MQIENITLHGFKGIDSSDKIGPLTLFVGPNGSGKSARLQAIQWAMTGCSRLGKKPEAASVYGCPTGMKVEVRLDDGFHVTRGIDLDNREGKMTQILSTDASEPLGIRDSQARIEEHVGRFMPMWDLNEFLALKAEGRRELILSLCGKASGVSIHNAQGQIETEILNGLLGRGTVAEALAGTSIDSPRHMEIRRELIQRLSAEHRAALSSVYGAMRGVSKADVSEYLSTMTAKVKEIISSSKAAAEAATQAARALADRKAEVQVPAGTVDQLREQQGQLVAQLEEVLKQIGIQEGKGSARKSLVQELARCLEMKGRQEEHLKLASEADVTEDMARALAMEQEAEDLAVTVHEVEDNLPALQDAMANARAAYEEAGVLLSGATRFLGSAEVSLAQKQAELAAAEQSDWMKVLELAKKLDAESVCGDQLTIDELISVATRNANPQRVEDLRKTVEGLQTDVSLLKAEKEQRQGQLATATDAMRSAEAAFNDGIKARHEQQKASERSLGRIHELKQRASSIRESLRQRDESISRATTNIAELEARRIELEGKLNTLDAEGGQVPLELLKQDETAIRAQRDAIERDIEALIRFANLNAELNRAIARAEQQRMAHVVAKAGLRAIKDVREQIMSDMLYPLLAMMTEFLTACGLRKRAYSRLENHKGTPIFDLGWTDGTQEISMDALSGGESVIFYAALGYAMTLLADPPLKVMLIEAAELDGDREAKLMAGLTAASHRIDNILVASCSWNALDWENAPMPWTVIRMAGEGVAA